jgi:hypothetical protein
MVALILAFIFLTPREVFRDQPRASNVVRLPAEQGTQVYWGGPELLTEVPEAARAARAAQIIRSPYGRSEKVVRVEPIVDREQETKGYLVYTQP